MDVLGPELSAFTDTDLNIDNTSLTFDEFDLEKFINDDLCMPEEAISAIAYNHPHSHSNGNGFRINNLHLRGLPPQSSVQQTSMSQTLPLQTPTSMYCDQQQQQLQQQQQQQQQRQNSNLPYLDNHMLHTTLPDSPPDSEPYSPPDGHPNHHPNTQIDNSKYTLTSTPNTMHSHMYPTHHRPPGMSTPKTIVTMPGYHESPLHTHHLPPTHQPPQLPPQVTMSLPMPTPQGMGGINPQILTGPNLSPQNKKRKHMTSPNGGIPGVIYNGRNGIIPSIKQEPGNAYTNSSFLPDCDEEYSGYDPDSSNGGFDNGVYQVIKWNKYQQNEWAVLTDSNLKDLPAPQYRVDADKGFNFSTSDESFVCQKKNHFQITCHIGVSGDPKYVRTPEGVKKIDHFCLHFNGVKLESQSQTIKIEQSQSDRSKKSFTPVRVNLPPDHVSKMTVGRLHFSETTSNNMRKKGRPNPDQRYFLCVVSLQAHSGENSYTVAANSSEKLIVRASNPGQFDSDVDMQHWQKGTMPDSVYHIGRVGVNTDHPDEALTVAGNIKLSGQILHTSDIRAKEGLQEIDPKEQLKKVSEMKIYNYKYSDDYADHVGMPEDRRKDTGVIAQELQEVLPDAVLETGDVKFENGGEIKNLLVVNKDRIFMENVGAVKELCKLTDNLEVRIDELEKMNSKLSKLKRFDSLKSTVSSKSTCSNSTINSLAPKKAHRYHRPKSLAPTPPTPSAPRSWCSNRFIQITIIILICIMAFCLIAITILYILERQKDNTGDNHTVVNNFHHPPSGGNATSQGTTSRPPGPPSTIRPVHTPNTTTLLTSQQVQLSTLATVAPIQFCSHVQPQCDISQCEETCCNEAGDAGDVDSPYQVIVREIQARKKSRASPQTPVPYTVNPQTTKGPDIHVVMHDNNSDKGPSYTAVNGGPYYRRRRSVYPPRFMANITIEEVNFTLTDGCLNRAGSDVRNKTYLIPFSKYSSPRDNYTLKFQIGDDEEVHMCHHDVVTTCRDIPNGEQHYVELAYQWQIPYGKYAATFFRFRVTRKRNTAVCMQPPSESEGYFMEYNLYFTRACSSSDE